MKFSQRSDKFLPALQALGNNSLSVIVLVPDGLSCTTILAGPTIPLLTML